MYICMYAHMYYVYMYAYIMYIHTYVCCLYLGAWSRPFTASQQLKFAGGQTSWTTIWETLHTWFWKLESRKSWQDVLSTIHLLKLFDKYDQTYITSCFRRQEEFCCQNYEQSRLEFWKVFPYTGHCENTTLTLEVSSHVTQCSTYVDKERYSFKALLDRLGKTLHVLYFHRRISPCFL